MDNIIIVAGCQRSGTTLMGQILGAHPESVLIDESDGLYEWTSAKFKNSDSAGRILDECLISSSRKYRDSVIRFGKSGVLLSHIRYLILKAPNLTYAYDHVSALAQNVQVVFMVRDIRDVARSILSFDRVPILRNQLRLLENVDRIENDYQLEYNIIRRSSASKYDVIAALVKIKMSHFKHFKKRGISTAIVKYEDLVDTPESTISSLLRDLNLPFSSSCVDYSGVYQGRGPGGMIRRAPIHSSSRKRWKKELSSVESREIWNVVGDFMEELGYHFEG